MGDHLVDILAVSVIVISIVLAFVYEKREAKRQKDPPCSFCGGRGVVPSYPRPLRCRCKQDPPALDA